MLTKVKYLGRHDEHHCEPQLSLNNSHIQVIKVTLLKVGFLNFKTYKRKEEVKIYIITIPREKLLFICW